MSIQGQDSCVRALETYSTLFNFTLRSFDVAVSPSTGKVITQVDVGLKALTTGVEVNEECFLYITLNDKLLVTEIVESCNSLAEFLALQSKPEGQENRGVRKAARQAGRNGGRKETRLSIER